MERKFSLITLSVMTSESTLEKKITLARQSILPSTHTYIPLTFCHTTRTNATQFEFGKGLTLFIQVGDVSHNRVK